MDEQCGPGNVLLLAFTFEHLSDQLLLPMALVGGGSFTAGPTDHESIG
ncbi:RNA 3'-terminal phosphate cyclase [Pseudomonas chlororaphis]|nr:RNA 3'-terminal phosphate cyclase [Pseudomonas chlororaphis]ETD37979.1 hypothetical protein U724_19035 [Pseudomonas chlororaphis subsp. aurantiaca PB-St2]